MFKKIFAMLMILSTILVTGCSNESTYSFKGESNNWHIQYDLKQTDERQLGEYSIKYVGAGTLKEPFSYEISSEFLSIEEQSATFNKKKNILTAQTECTNKQKNERVCSMANEDSIINVIIEWNGEKEIIEMNLAN